MAPERDAQPADPTIAEVFRRFLAAEERRLAPRTFARYRDVLDLFRGCMDDYAPASLDADDTRRYRRLHGEEGGRTREYCEIFGPERILENVGEFLGYYMVRKVMAGEDFLRAAGTVTKKLAAWLAENGYVEPEDADDAVDRGGRAARDLPAAAKLAALLHAFAEGGGPREANDVEDRFEVTRVGRGKVWLKGMGGRVLGPIAVPEEVSLRCRPGWAVSGVVGRRRGTWRLLEAWNVYP